MKYGMKWRSVKKATRQLDSKNMNKEPETKELLLEYKRRMEERLADAETKTLTAIFEFKRVMNERDKLIIALVASARVMEGTYASWGSAGGAPECPHGFNVGIPCRQCDINLVVSALETHKKLDAICEPSNEKS